MKGGYVPANLEPPAADVEDTNNKYPPQALPQATGTPVTLAIDGDASPNQRAYSDSATSATTYDAAGNTNDVSYLGIFSSSICGMFQSHRFSRTDACAMACCGVWLWERNQFMFDGTMPKPWKERPHAIAMVTALALVGFIYSQFDIRSQRVGLICFAGIVFGMIVVLCKFQGDRRSLRLKLAKAQYYREHPHQNPETIPEHENRDLQYYLYQHQMEISRAHMCCACFSKDSVGPPSAAHASGGSSEDEVYDFCTRLWRFIAASCCGGCCNSWCMCCGMCAIAQEHRHLAITLPESSSEGQPRWEHDYVTIQPWSEYDTQIRRVRDSADSSWSAHYGALSQLSRNIIKVTMILVVIVMVLAVLPFLYMPIWQFPILIAALLQPAVIMYFVYWTNHRFDISLDAVIKYFASGFVICSGISLAYETIASIITSTIVLLTGAIGALFIFADASVASNAGSGGGRVGADILVFIIFQIVFKALLNAFIVAALVEELSKYLCFWMVEHPDMVDSADSATTSHGEGAVVGKRKSNISKGSAITIAMVSTAVGFACAENLLYVFLYSKPDASVEIITLVLRSLLPVHPLCAAMQSIGVCRRDLEKDRTMQTGRIIRPAWWLHGSYDFILMAFTAIYLVIREWRRFAATNHCVENDDFGFDFDVDCDLDNESDDSDFMRELVDTIPILIVGALVALVGLWWYVKQARLQHQRLLIRDLDVRRGQDNGLQLQESLQLT